MASSTNDDCHSSYKIVNNSNKKSYSSGPNCAEELFDETGKLYFMIFDEEVLQTNTCGEIKENDLVLARLEYTLGEMKNANWEIIYNE